MADDTARADGVRAKFETEGQSWGERAACGELSAVLSPTGGERLNKYLHGVSLFAAKQALSLRPGAQTILDFGCGTGRFLRFFGAGGRSVIGTEITREMLAEARRYGVPPRSGLVLNDGVHIPFVDHSFDMIWVCGVLKYSLFVSQPAYPLIAHEMYRVLKPGGMVANVEMYVEAPPNAFTVDFERAGFKTERVRVLQRYYRRPDAYGQSPLLPLSVVAAAGQFVAAVRSRLDDPHSPATGLRDYLFIWTKA